MKLVGENQNAFIPGRRIGDNILLAHDLCHNLHHDKGTGRMCLKIDLRNACDTISWKFLDETLGRFGFNGKWRTWMKACVNATFVVNVNGAFSSPFKASNGLCQGDPLVPYLFVLGMEVLSAMIKCEEHGEHLNSARCGDLRVSHLIFADDIMLFSGATKDDSRTITLILEEFTKFSRLGLNPLKSQNFLGGRVTHG